MQQNVFGFGSVPVRVAAKVYGRDPAWIRAGIIVGWLPIGQATRHGKQVTDIKKMNSKLGRINYFIFHLSSFMSRLAMNGITKNKVL